MSHRVILADPPWYYKAEGMGQRSQSRASNKYPCIPTQQICQFQAQRFAAEDAYLFLWSTNHHLLHGDATRVVKAWGFRPITFRVWLKPSAGIGYYWRNAHENLVLGVRGRPGQFELTNILTWFHAPRRAHSQKPELYQEIETWTGGPYLELFAREPQPGWTSWGNQVGDSLGTGFDPRVWGLSP